MPPSPKSGQQAQPPEKKKRRQNVACDSCRLRRVKCDMLALLTPADSTRVMPPLPVLVRQNPDVSCSNCISKGIRCTTNQIVNPSKPNKGGKRIEEAKKMYGSEGISNTPSASGTAAPPTPSLTVPTPLRVPTPQRQRSGVAASSSALSSSFGLLNPSAVPTSADFNFVPFDNQYPAYPGSDLLNNLGATTGPSLLPTWTTEWTSNNVSSAFGTAFGPFDMGPPPPAADPPPTWDAFLFPQPSSESSYPQAEQVTYDASSLYPSSATPSQMTMSSLPTFEDSARGVPSDSSLFPSPSGVPSVSPRTSYEDRSNHPFRPEESPGSLSNSSHSLSLPESTQEQSSSPSISRSRSATYAPPQVVGKKRRSTDDDVIEIVRDEDDNAVENPWALWETCNKDKEGRMIRWSRSDNVSDSLASRALGSELSRHLVRVYFSSVHLTLPAISPEAFYMAWQQAGERSDRMTPAQEVLCAVIEAWAARFSDHPVVLGMDPNRATNTPKLILADKSGEHDSVTIDQSQYGRKRLRVCLALVDRARKLIDQHGILRKPSVTGVQALALFTQLQHMTDHNPDAADTLMETEMLHTILIQQLRRLDLRWSSDGPVPIFPNQDGPTTNDQQRIKQRRLFWTVLIADSFWAAGTAQNPVIRDDEVQASLAWLKSINSKHMPSTFQSMTFFMGSWHRVATLTREVARNMALPLKRPGRVDVTEFCNSTRQIWRGVRDLYQSINSKVEEVLSCSKEELLGISPVHQFTSLRLATTYILLIMQQTIQQLLDFRRRLHEAYILDDTVPLQAQPEAARVRALEELSAQSIDILLANTRAQAPLFASLMSTGFIQGGSMILRVLLTTAQFLAEVPTVEQGYPNHTRGGVDWTWENKQADVACCVKALQQLGWAWADVTDVLQRIKATMAKMTPSAETILSYMFNAQEISDEASKNARQRERDGRRDSQALDAVLTFWPPVSVPMTLGLMTAEQVANTQKEGIDYGQGVFENTPLMRREVSLGQRTVQRLKAPQDASREEVPFGEFLLDSFSLPRKPPATAEQGTLQPVSGSDECTFTTGTRWQPTGQSTVFTTNDANGRQTSEAAPASSPPVTTTESVPSGSAELWPPMNAELGGTADVGIGPELQSFLDSLADMPDTMGSGSSWGEE